jgi:2-polyprenyl-6-methoxyphenol hydroxylase-like FAD-dependent oxidoreductase
MTKTPGAVWNAPILIVGAGPVGLTLAIDLAWRGIEVLVAEVRAMDDLPSVKCNHVSARSMEIFRRLGVAQALRDTGLPPDYPNDVSYRTSFTGMELSRIPIPCRADRYTSTVGPDTWWPTPEPPHRINQIFLEPVLRAHAARIPNLTILYRTKVEAISQDDHEVTVQATCLDSERQFPITCRYLVGCDGGRSMVRRVIGAQLHGDAVVQRVQSTDIRAPSLLSLTSIKPAWASFALNPRRSGNVYAIDGRERWLVHNYLRWDETDFESVDRDACIRQILGVGPHFEYELLAKEDWIGRRLVADRFRDRRLFICGDAAHLWVPMAGYGMNAGIADACDLSWQLAGVLSGWADPDLLEAYEAERQPITDQVSRFAMDHALALAAQRQGVPDDIEVEGPHGDAVRARIGQAAYDLNVNQYCCGGLNFGYFYDRSPVIAYDGEMQPAYSMASFTPSTVPGCRAPHVWLEGGVSLYDMLGAAYTLIRTDPAIDVGAIVNAAEQRGVPLTILDASASDAGNVYDQPLVMVRPDQHVAWRGVAVPDEIDALIDLMTGRAPPIR